MGKKGSTLRKVLQSSEVIKAMNVPDAMEEYFKRHGKRTSRDKVTILAPYIRTRKGERYYAISPE